MTKHIFDFDNTVVFTDVANGIAYNKALEQMGLASINSESRITRETVYLACPYLPKDKIDIIVEKKQLLFSPVDTFLNEHIISLVKQLGPDKCVLWSRADSGRVKKILEYYDIYTYFGEIVFNSKESIITEVRRFCDIYSCEPNELIFYDDDLNDLEQAAKAGSRIVHVTPEKHTY